MMTECVSYYTLSKQFSDMMISMYAADFMKLSCSGIRETVIDIFAGLCFYRAMHFSAKRGIAIACRLSVHLSVRLFVPL